MRRLSVPRRISSVNSSEPGSGPSFSSGPSSPGARTHHAALRSCPCSRTSSALPLSKRNRTAEPLARVFFGGSSMSSRPACDRWTSTRTPSSSSNTRYLARRPTDRTVWPTIESAAGTTVFSAAKPRGSTPVISAPPIATSSRSASACISGSSGTHPG